MTQFTSATRKKLQHVARWLGFRLDLMLSLIVAFLKFISNFGRLPLSNDQNDDYLNDTTVYGKLLHLKHISFPSFLEVIVSV